MLTRISGFVAFVLLIGSSAFANQVVCDGSYVVYRFRAQGYLNSSDTRIRGNVNVTVTGAGQTRHVILKVTSSDIKAGSHIRATGTMQDGSGNVNATYDAGSQTYRGVLHGQDSERTYNVNVVCGIYQN